MKTFFPSPWETVCLSVDLGFFILNIYFCLSLQYVAVEVVEYKGEEQVEDQKVANDESWYED